MTEFPEDFATFWRMYPKKRKKPDALKAWRQTEGVRPDLGDLLTALYAMCLCRDWQREGGQFVPYPATWLRAHGWEDEPEVSIAPEVLAWEAEQRRISEHAQESRRLKGYRDLARQVAQGRAGEDFMDRITTMSTSEINREMSDLTGLRDWTEAPVVNPPN